MRLIELVLLYLLDRVKQNTATFLRFVTISNATVSEKMSPAGNENESLLHALIVMDFHRLKMNEFLCHKFLVDNFSSFDDKKDVFLSDDDDDGEKKTKLGSHDENQPFLIRDEGSRQYKTWLRRIGRLTTRETKEPPSQRYKLHKRVASYYPLNKFSSTDGSYIKQNNVNTLSVRSRKKNQKPGKYAPVRNRFFPDRRVTKNKLRDYWRWQSKYKPPYYRKGDFAYGPPPMVKASLDSDKPWFITTESSRSMTNYTTMKLDYNFWNMESTTTMVPKYGEFSNFVPSPSMYGSAWHEDNKNDDHIHWFPPPDMMDDVSFNCENKDDDADDSNQLNDENNDDDGPLSELGKNDMYHTVVVVFAFIGFTTFLMNMMAAFTSNNNGGQSAPSIMFVGNNNEDEEQQGRFGRGSRNASLNILLRQIALHISEFQEVLGTISKEQNML